MRSSPTPQPRAFTLMELLTVIAVIGVLAALLLPTVRAMRIKSDQTQCTSNLRQVVAGTILSANDHSGRCPSMIEYPWEPNGSYIGPGNAGTAWNGPTAPWVGDVLAPYLGCSQNSIASVLRCPAAQQNNAQSWLRQPQYTNYIYNTYYAQNKRPLFGASSAMVFFDTCWNDWAPGVYAHNPGSGAFLQAGYLDGHIRTMSYNEFQAENNSDNSASVFFEWGWILQRSGTTP